MRKLVLLIISMFALQCVQATESTKYLENLYSDGVKIVSKSEFTDCYAQKIGDNNISAIVYGNGYMKKHKCKKTKITYITLLDSSSNPVWGYVIPR